MISDHSSPPLIQKLSQNNLHLMPLKIYTDSVIFSFCSYVNHNFDVMDFVCLNQHLNHTLFTCLHFLSCIILILHLDSKFIHQCKSSHWGPIVQLVFASCPLQHLHTHTDTSDLTFICIQWIMQHHENQRQVTSQCFFISQTHLTMAQ